MKILVVGSGISNIHEKAVNNSLQKLGNEVYAFYWDSIFHSTNIFMQFLNKFQNHYLFGYKLYSINQKLIKYIDNCLPEMIFIYRGTHIFPSTLKTIKLRLPNTIILGYNNDDPFSPHYPKFLWRHFLKSLPLYDLVFAYRKHNIFEYYRYGAKKVELLMPWFIPFNKDSIEVQKDYDVVFVGHFEDDGRLEYIKLLMQENFKLGLFGPNWEKCKNSDIKNKFGIIKPLNYVEYHRVISSSKIAICFFSRLNRDVYTRRCFEIPSLGVFMLCQHSDEIANIYDENIEAVFFKNQVDFIDKVRYYLTNDKEREKIALNGYIRVNKDGHDIDSRMKYVLNIYFLLNSKK